MLVKKVAQGCHNPFPHSFWLQQLEMCAEKADFSVGFQKKSGRHYSGGTLTDICPVVLDPFDLKGSPTTTSARKSQGRSQCRRGLLSKKGMGNDLTACVGESPCQHFMYHTGCHVFTDAGIPTGKI